MEEISYQNRKQAFQKFLFRYEKPLGYVGWTIFIIVALLQMWKVKSGFITNYGADSIAPIMLYYSARTNKTLLSKLFKEHPTKYRLF